MSQIYMHLAAVLSVVVEGFNTRSTWHPHTRIPYRCSVGVRCRDRWLCMGVMIINQQNSSIGLCSCLLGENLRILSTQVPPCRHPWAKPNHFAGVSWVWKWSVRTYYLAVPIFCVWKCCMELEKCKQQQMGVPKKRCTEQKCAAGLFGPFPCCSYLL